MSPSSKSSGEHASNAGVNALTPYLVCAGAADAIAFYKKAFGAEEALRIAGPNETILHACLQINGSSVMLTDACPAMNAVDPNTLGGSPVTIHLKVDDADNWVRRAEAAGATVVMPVAEMFWGDRYGVVKDPFGHIWSMGTPVRTLSEAELCEAAKAAMAEMAG
jgi:uncharacterized glyoxalase superfamily protein PhnB